MPSTLLGIARGVLGGRLENRADQIAAEERRRQHDAEDLRQIIELSQTPGFSIGADDGSGSGGTAVAPPVIPPPVKPITPATPIAAARKMIGPQLDDADVTTSTSDDATRGPDLPSSTKKPVVAADLTPARSPLVVAKRAIGGRQLDVTLDPTQTTGAKRKELLRKNQEAFGRLNADGSMGEFDPTFDYLGKERSDLDEKELEKELIAANVPPADAKLLAKHHVDMAARRIKTATDARAETRAERTARLAEETLEERRRHNRATEVTADKRVNKTGGLGSNDPTKELAGVNRQISQTSTALNAARRAIPKKNLLYGLDSTVTADYDSSAAPITGVVNQLVKRADSLRTVGDSLNAVIQRKGTAKKTLSAADAARAKKDPKFAEWLRSKGLL